MDVLEGFCGRGKVGVARFPKNEGKRGAKEGSDFIGGKLNTGRRGVDTKSPRSSEESEGKTFEKTSNPIGGTLEGADSVEGSLSSPRE